MRTTLPGVAPIVMVEERPLLNFSTLLTWRSSIGVIEPTFCTSVRQEVIDITLGSYGLLDSIID